jgi:multidrug efflux system membrane fusion protein
MRARAFFVLVLLAAGIGGAAWYFADAKPAPTSPQGHRGEGGRIPVVPATVAQQDVPIYLDGLGTVQAFNSVVVRARVEGELQKVAFTEGQDVKEGDLLAQIDPRPYQAQLAQAVAKKAQDEATLGNAKRELARYSELRKNNYATPQQVDQYQAQVDQLAATIKGDQAAIDSAQLMLGYTSIEAPIAGRVGMRQVDQGNIIRASDTNGLVMITQMKPISIVFTLPEQTLTQVIDASAEKKLEVIALDRDNATELSRGTLAVIDNQIDQSTGTVKLKATFANDDLRLWPGKFVNVRLLLTTRKDGIVVPAQVVQRGPKGAFAFVITDENKVELRPVRVAQIEDGIALIDEGLRPGERVVADGQSRLQAGSEVVLREASASGEGTHSQEHPKRARAQSKATPGKTQ